MSMSLGARENATAEINVTPLIDVLLVLLIIFMVVLPHHQRGETAEIPVPNTKPTPIRGTEDLIIVQLLTVDSGRIPALKINQDSLSGGTLWMQGSERSFECARRKSRS
jgi:biopolymer transport protein TolR